MLQWKLSLPRELWRSCCKLRVVRWIRERKNQLKNSFYRFKAFKKKKKITKCLKRLVNSCLFLSFLSSYVVSWTIEKKRERGMVRRVLLGIRKFFATKGTYENFFSLIIIFLLKKENLLNRNIMILCRYNYKFYFY